MYRDTDVVLAELKAEDWLASSIAIDEMAEPVTSTATCIEVTSVLESEWDQERLSQLPDRIAESGIDPLSLERDHLDAGGQLQWTHERLNYFDAIHLGTATVRDERIVSTDTLYPEVPEVTNVDPRDL